MNSARSSVRIARLLLALAFACWSVLAVTDAYMGLEGELHRTWSRNGRPKRSLATVPEPRGGGFLPFRFCRMR